jgi:arylsulfatase A-like enzyme
LLIVVDTLRKDHLGCYGYSRNTSPNVDRLARESVRYDRAISQAPWTAPSVGSLLTSQYPGVLGIEDEASILEDEWIVLPEVLREHGYVTAAVVSHIYCSSRWNFDQGFDFFDESNIQGHNDSTSADVTWEALTFLENRTDAPFFLFLHYFDPHDTYLEHTGFLFPSDEEYQLHQLPENLRPEDIAEVVRRYDSEIAFTDHHIGKVLDRLRELELYDDTLIVFTADHGEEFREHGSFRHGYTLYDELINVPLIIKYPDRGGEEVGHTVALLDLYPTILDLAGISVEHGMQGVSLAGSATGEEAPARTVFSETSRNNLLLRAAVTRRHKLILNPRTVEFEFYNLVADPGEQNILDDADPDGYLSLSESLQTWLNETSATRREGTRIELTPEEQERLRSLGYLE